jgi:hypothetical protein
MSAKNHPISILTASAKIHYIAIGIFTILFGLFYVFAYTNQFKDIRNQMENWRTSVLGSKPTDEAVDISDNENESDDESIDDESKILREILSPF